MTEPDPRDVPAEDLDENGLDVKGLAGTIEALNGALDEMAEQVRQLGEVTVTGRSDSDDVTVRVTRSGRLTRLSLRDGVTRRYDLVALGELIARTVAQTQQRANDEYQREIDKIEHPEFVVTPRGLRRAPQS